VAKEILDSLGRRRTDPALRKLHKIKTIDYTPVKCMCGQEFRNYRMWEQHRVDSSEITSEE
jgi:hypothetical protein